MKKYFYLSLMATALLSVGLFCSCQEKAKKEIKTVENGHECVDLGLSVYWASTNVGASSPEDDGGLYAFGEVETKSRYHRDTYKYLIPGKTIIDKDGFEKETSDEWPLNGKNIAGTEYDVAHVKWGGSWKIPTEAQFKELLEKCTWEITTKNGVNGYKITSKKNNNWIFLPFVKNGVPYYDSDVSYFYQTSSGDNFDLKKKALYFKVDVVGQPVRPVCE